MLTLQFMPYSEIASLTSEEKVKKLLKVAQEEKIILLQGRLKANEKSELIRKTMEQINERFKGIEIEEIEHENRVGAAFSEKVRGAFINMLLGNRMGLTVIGPASIVKEIKKDPDKIQLFTEDGAKKKRK